MCDGRLLRALLAAAAAALCAAVPGAQHGTCSCSRLMVALSTRHLHWPVCEPRRIDPNALLRSGVSRVNRAVAAGRMAAPACTERVLAHERAINVSVLLHTPEYHHYLLMQPPPGAIDAYVRMIAGRCVATSVSAAVADEFTVALGAAGQAFASLDVPSPAAVATPAPPPPPCNATAPYRTFDGSCNNLRQPMWGATGTPFRRLLCPNYSDGLYDTAVGQDGRGLPSARLVRQLAIRDAPRDALLISLATMQWGQVVAHDTALSFDATGITGLGVQCCARTPGAPTNRTPLPKEQLSVQCLPVEGPDTYCLSLARGNVTFENERGLLGPGEQVNFVNHLLDLSVAYGSDAATAAQLREGAGGRLNSSARMLLPLSGNPLADCDPRRLASPCFVAGDPRVNQNTHLTVLQTMFMREHNRLATALARLNPQWDDERLYQEARRINNAQYQHITYDRIVPIYVGPLYALLKGLLPARGYDPRGYDPSLDPSTLNSFTGAVYRIFHGLAQPNLHLVPYAGGCPVGRLRMEEWFDTPAAAVEPPGRFDQLLLGLTTQPAQDADRFYTEALSNHMFETNMDQGQDLASLDTQRGRDHGLAPYTAFKRLCGLGDTRSWSDMASLIPDDLVQRLRTVYRHWNDVDLFVGAFLERRQALALAGPTAQCIIAEQFARWKFGDRFFYDFAGQAGSFRPDQLAQIKRASLSRLVCDNGDNVTHMQWDAFFQPGLLNHVVPCSEIPAVDLTPWKERR